MGKVGGEKHSVVSYWSLPQDGGKEFMCVKDTHKEKKPSTREAIGLNG